MTGRTIRIHEYFFWSVMLGEHAVRFSVFDGQGKEYWRIEKLESKGKKLREMREEIASRILEAMDAGQEPGEV